MYASLINEGEDFATLQIQLGKDDDLTLLSAGSGGLTIQLPLFDHEAKEISDTLDTMVARADRAEAQERLDRAT